MGVMVFQGCSPFAVSVILISLVAVVHVFCNTDLTSGVQRYFTAFPDFGDGTDGLAV